MPYISLHTMKYKTNSRDYKTKRLSWPKWLPRKCPCCGAKVKYKDSDNGKLVHCFGGIIYQVRNRYACTNLGCKMYGKGFNPCPRFDYGEREYGADVFRWIAEKLLLFPTPIKTIHKELLLKHGMKICLRTVQRICDDIIQLKAHNIDINTLEVLKSDPFVIIGLDGQEPKKGGRSLWIFLDLIHGRVLHTCVLESINFKILHDKIELIRENYSVSIRGFVSDKQGLINKCMKHYYPKIPHQYCQFHFLNNQWKHITAFDSNVYLPLKKTIDDLYIHKASSSISVKFEGVGKRPVREVFKTLDRDFQAMARVSNKTFKRLRGITLYSDLTTYVEKMRVSEKQLDPDNRFSKIFRATRVKIEAVLKETALTVKQTGLLFTFFQEIRGTLKNPTRPGLIQQIELDNIYKEVWNLAQLNGLTKDLDEIRTFQARKSTSFHTVLAEFCRLWVSYQPGLFQYEKFSSDLRTNLICENLFSREKQALIRRGAKKVVNHLIETRGAAYVRICCCEPEELESDVVQEYSIQLMQELRDGLNEKIKASTSRWYRQGQDYNGSETAIREYYKERGGEKRHEEED